MSDINVLTDVSQESEMYPLQNVQLVIIESIFIILISCLSSTEPASCGFEFKPVNRVQYNQGFQL